MVSTRDSKKMDDVELMFLSRSACDHKAVWVSSSWATRYPGSR